MKTSTSKIGKKQGECEYDSVNSQSMDQEGIQLVSRRAKFPDDAPYLLIETETY